VGAGIMTGGLVGRWDWEPDLGTHKPDDRCLSGYRRYPSTKNLNQHKEREGGRTYSTSGV
jgi:hypothetical protein